MKKLLRLVRDKMAEREVDVTMKFTLSALWNLTGEACGVSSFRCQKFCNVQTPITMLHRETFSTSGIYKDTITSDTTELRDQHAQFAESLSVFSLV